MTATNSEETARIQTLRKACVLNCDLDPIGALGDLAPEAMLQLLPCGVFTTNTDHRITYWNRAAEKMLGYTAEEVIGKRCSEICLEPCETCVGVQAAAPRQSFNAIQDVECIFRHKVGPTITVSKSSHPIYDDSGCQIGSLESFIDISERKENEARKEQQALDKLRRTEAMYRDTLRYLAAGYYRVSVDGVLQSHNHEFNLILGCDPDADLMGMSLVDFWNDPNDRELYLEEFRRKGFIKHYRAVMKRPGGELFQAEISARLVKDEQGEPLYIEGTFFDVSERHKLEETRRENEARIQAIAKALPDALFVIDEEGRYLEVLSPDGHLLELDIASLNGRLMRDVLPTDKADYFLALVEKTLSENSSQICEYSVEADSNVRYFEGRTAPLGVKHDGKRAVVFLERDITKRRQMQASLVQADRLSSMGMLAAGVAHEINNPLSYILYNLNSLNEEIPKLTPAQTDPRSSVPDARGSLLGLEHATGERRSADASAMREILTRVQETLDGANHIKTIARGLGGFSRVEKDELASIDIIQVIEAAVNMARNEIKYKARVVKDYGKVPRVMASEGRLSQVFLNLLINAAHAMDGLKSKENHIHLRTWEEYGQACIEVRDTGCGIPAEKIERVFEPFFSTKAIGVGSGLGLPISKEIIEGYGGTISVRSEADKGTSFLIRIPAQSKEVSTSPPPIFSSATDSPRSRILVVDDEDPIRSVMTRILRKHDIVEARSGAAARNILRKDQQFDVILCDIMMPDMTGLEVHSWLKSAHPDLADKVIFVTGGVFTQHEREYLGQIENHRVDKPFDAAFLKQVVGDAIASNDSDNAPIAAEINIVPSGLFSTDDVTQASGTLPALLADVPLVHLAEVRACILSGDMARLEETVERISIDHGAAGKRLRSLARRYEYDVLLDALGPETDS